MVLLGGGSCFYSVTHKISTKFIGDGVFGYGGVGMGFSNYTPLDAMRVGAFLYNEISAADRNCSVAGSTVGGPLERSLCYSLLHLQKSK